ncbi:MAG: 30S ribosomal protein S6 [Gemmatimonadota bacterium]|nr:MAG: 30S ribosomal protein S6 [Gemmatimonadota bacterium]
MSRKYEVVYIFDSALEEPQVDEHLTRFHELLKSPDYPEPITDVSHWGKRTLAYPIKNREQGHYVVAQFETDQGLLDEFERAIKLDEGVLRYLVVINEGLATVPTTVDRVERDAEEDEGEAPLESEEEAE